MNDDFVVEKDGKQFIDIVKILPETLPSGKRIIWKELSDNKIEIYIPASVPGRGHDSKKFAVNRYFLLDDLFFEGLGLWQGDGGKGKGLYFGNNCLELVLHFLKFVEEKIDLSRDLFKITINSNNIHENEKTLVEKLSSKLNIKSDNFTRICIDKRLNNIYIQLYINGFVLTEIMKLLNDNLKTIILENNEFSCSYLKGVFASEGSVVFRSSGIISHVDFSSKDRKIIDFVKNCLSNNGISHGTYS